MRYISFNYSSLDRFRQAILVSYMVNVGFMVLGLLGATLENVIATFYLENRTWRVFLPGSRSGEQNLSLKVENYAGKAES